MTTAEFMIVFWTAVYIVALYKLDKLVSIQIYLTARNKGLSHNVSVGVSLVGAIAQFGLVVLLIKLVRTVILV